MQILLICKLRMWENKKKYASSLPFKAIMRSKLKKKDFHKVLNFQVKCGTHSTKTPRGHWEFAVTRCSAVVWVTGTFPTCLSQLWDIPVTISDNRQGYWGLSSMSLSMADRFWGLSSSNNLTNPYLLWAIATFCAHRHQEWVCLHLRFKTVFQLWSLCVIR